MGEIIVDATDDDDSDDDNEIFDEEAAVDNADDDFCEEGRKALKAVALIELVVDIRVVVD